MKDFTLLKWRGLKDYDSLNHIKALNFEKTKSGIANFKLIYLFLISFLLISTGEIKAQESVGDIFDLPDARRCVSNDLRVVEATLEFDLCGPICEEGEIIEYPLTLAIFNNTGSERTSFAFFAKLEQYNPDGSLANTYFISGCKGPVPPNTTTEITFDETLEIVDENGDPTSFDGVPYLCGGSLKLINVYEAWTDASDNQNRQCPLEASSIAPKCGVLSSIEIQTPISAFVEDTTNVSCFGGSDGAIDITVTGGFEPYTFVWTKTGGGFSASTEDVSNLSSGTYHVTVTDFKGCTVTLEDIVIGQPEELGADISSMDVSCKDGSDGSITISNPTGGSGFYEYSIDGGLNWQSSGSFTGLMAKSYNVQIRDANVPTCKITLNESLDIEEPAVLAADIASEDVSCKDGNDGSITISNPSGGSGNYEFSIDGGSSWQSSGSFTNLSANSYNVQIRDADAENCVIILDDNLIIGEPDVLDADVASEDIKCNGEAGGSITITNPSGGSGNYQYSIDGGSNWQASGNFTGLPAAFYNVQIRDADAIDCIIVLDDNLEIEQPFVLTADVASEDVTCFDGSDGSITITNPSGGSGNYEYSIDGGSTWQSSGSFTSLSANSYNVQIRDANAEDCVITLDENLIIGEPDVLAADVDSEDVSCFDGSDGSITITNPSGGSGDYEYSIDGGSTWQSGGSFTGLPAASYNVQIRDENAPSCVIILDENLDLEEPAVLAATVEASDVSCTNNGGSILISNPTGGSGEYEFSIDGGTSWQSSGSFNSLAGGFYDVQIRDKNNPDCVIGLNDSLEIVDPGFPGGDLEVKDVSCFDGSDGSITVTVSGGVAPYKVNGNVVDETNIFVLSGLSAGFYGVTIEDSNGCALVIDDVEIKQPPILDPPSLQMPPLVCFSDPGSFIIDSETNGLLFRIDDGDFLPYPEGGYTDIPVGIHTITAKTNDDAGCESIPLEFEIFPAFSVPVMPLLDAVQPSCDILTGTIIVTNHVAGQTYYVRLASEDPSPIFVSYPEGGFSGLAPGDYIVLARSIDECSSDAASISLIEATNCDDFEGCTLGYWKNHTDRWTCYSTCTLYGEVFTSAPSQLSGLTLLEVLNLGGGGIYNLGRQSVAALLNTCHEDINYEILTTDELIAYVNASFGNAGEAGSFLDSLNNAGCTLGGSRATTKPTEGCESIGPKPKPGKDKKAGFTADFKAYPVPFKESLNIQYEFNYKSDVSIEIFDLQGKLLRTYKARKVSKGDVTALELDFATKSNQVYAIKVKTDRDVFIKKIISDK